MPWHEKFDTNKAITLCLHEKYGVVDSLNRTKLAFKYENIDAGRFELQEQPLSRICENGLWGFVDRNYDVAIPCKYKQCAGGFFSVGEFWRAIVTDKDGKEHLINEKGIDVLPSKYSNFRIPINREYVAECFYQTLFGGWQKEYVSTIDGHVIGSNSNAIDQKTKDVLAWAIIYGSVAAAKSGIKMLASMLGYPIPDRPYESYYSKQVRDRAWAEYKRTGNIIDAINALFS